MMLGMFWKRTTSTAAFWGLIVGMITSFSIFLGFKLSLISPTLATVLTFSAHPSEMSRNLWQASWGWLLCLLCTIAISLFTKPKPDSELVGLVKGFTEDKKLQDVPLWGRPSTWAIVAFIVLVALNIYFW
jgi:SSS family solute:Na+ symporter